MLNSFKRGELVYFLVALACYLLISVTSFYIPFVIRVLVTTFLAVASSFASFNKTIKPEPPKYITSSIQDDFHFLHSLNRAHIYLQVIRRTNWEALKSECARKRDEVAHRLNASGPPPQFRLIDCKSTCDRQRVVLVDWQQDEYTAISHTWGEEAYAVFNCECASDCSACNIPRYIDSTPACPGPEAHHPRHAQVIGDILNMCKHLMEAGGCKFLWHDGVCIAQHNEKEVSDTIRHMGWVYANASDTIIFLHNVGNPMSLLSPLHEPAHESRWNRRVWTLQEAILSRRRRYCIRLVHFDCEPLDDFFTGPYDSAEEWYRAKLAYLSEAGHLQDMASYTTLWQDFETKLEQCYKDDSSIAVIEEECLWSHLLLVYSQVLCLLKCRLVFPSHNINVFDFMREFKWHTDLQSWTVFLKEQCYKFPDQLFEVICQCACFRESKHEGDRINSLLGLAGITDFDAPKDGEFENSTIKFLERVAGQEQQQALLQDLLFSVNRWHHEPESAKRHTWLPCISRPITPIRAFNTLRNGMLVNIMENGMVQVRGPMYSIPIKFTMKSHRPFAPLPLRKNSIEYEQIYRDCRVLTLALLNEVPRESTLKAFAHGSHVQLGHVICSLDEISHTHVFPLHRHHGSSIHLVFGEFDKRIHTKALIVKGDENLAARNYPVSKLGVFECLSHDLLSFIFHRTPFPFPITILNTLTID